MIKRLFLLPLLLLFSIFTRASEDNWTLYPSYQNSTYCQVAGKKVYILASGALYSFNTADNELYTYDKLNSLSDIDITHIAYSDFIKGLVIIYKNANIDILYDDGTVYNITDFKNSNIINKTINSIYINNNIAYLSTGFGTVVLDMEMLEIKNSYITGRNTLSTFLSKGILYTGTDEGIFRCDTTKNMLDRNNWEKVNSNIVSAFSELNNDLYILIKDSDIKILNTENNELKSIDKIKGNVYTNLYKNDNEIIATSNSRLTIIKNLTEISTYSTSNSIYILKNKEYFWNCKGYKGVYKCKIEYNELKDIDKIFVNDSPIRNYCEFMKFTDDEKLLVAGGNLNFFDATFYEGTIMEYNIMDHNWINFPEDEIKQKTGYNYVNICSVDEDPTEPGHYFASSFGYGIYEFRNGEFIKHYNDANSMVESAAPGRYSYAYCRVPTVKFDNEGNLWCINTGVKDIVKVLKKNGEWVSLNYDKIEYKPTMVKPLFDSRGWLWITSLQGWEGDPGIFCAKPNNTLFDTSDDETKLWTDKFTNQDGVSYDIYQVYSLCEDLDGYIWIGTNTGLFLIDNPEEFFSHGTFKQIKVPRNDGTGLADYLMGGIYIKAMDIDGANRKWIGTLDNGVYLISEDGLETIHHFTTENSPLPSNYIESIAVNQKTGEVFIGTDKGIASYRSDATRPEKKLESKTIHAYPNPVRSNYNGNISIKGLTDDCNVKIIDGAGYLINEGYSNGGTYVWNGRNKKGEKVSSGVYHVLLYDKEGKDGEVTKILITR